MYRVSYVVVLFALCLLAGTALGMLWANLAPQTYQDMVELRLIDGFPIGYPNPDATGFGGRTLTLQYLVNTVFLSLFFLLAGKELWEAVAQKNGALRGQAAVVPLGAALGSMVVPVLIYLAIAATTRSADWADLRAGWMLPAATDLVLVYVVGRTVFGAKHPALRLLMLVACTSDIAVVIALALFNPIGVLRPLWLLVPLGAALVVWGLFRDVGRDDVLAVRGWKHHMGLAPWLLAGVASWLGVQQAGLHPALGLLPILPVIPRASRAFGFFAEAEDYLVDPLNRIAHYLKLPTAAGLFLYGLTSGGAEFAAYDPATTVSFFALILGKPVGLMAGAVLTARLFAIGLPRGVSRADLALMGVVASAGLIVPLLVANTALPGGAVQQAAKLGIVCSLTAAPCAVLIARAARLGRWKTAAL